LETRNFLKLRFKLQVLNVFTNDYGEEEQSASSRSRFSTQKHIIRYRVTLSGGSARQPFCNLSEHSKRSNFLCFLELILKRQNYITILSSVFRKMNIKFGFGYKLLLSVFIHITLFLNSLIETFGFLNYIIH
jgi:hypothetical protein